MPADPTGATHPTAPTADHPPRPSTRATTPGPPQLRTRDVASRLLRWYAASHPLRPLRPLRPRPLLAARRRGPRFALPVVLALLAVPLVTAAQHSRPAPYGDHFRVHARVDADGRGAPASRAADGQGTAVPRVSGRAVRAYDTVRGRVRWTYTREGRRPLVLRAAGGHALTLWDDGLVTDTARGGVRWHRAIPESAHWLRTPGARGGSGVLRPLDPAAHMLAVVTPHRIAAYRTVDGDLRWTLPARRGCAFAPARSLRRDRVLLVAQPCRDRAAPWTAQLVAVDDLGRVTPRRTPLGNDVPGAPRA
ncbi:hypothetical protein [Streptomyces sp. NPDC059063]|uniref:hypothetical protein n=1 Tax=unclassified Streptomyces TaxID=2593676 RepID=UPI0036C543AA